MRAGNVEWSAVCFTLFFCFFYCLIGIRKLHAGVAEDHNEATFWQRLFHKVQQYCAVFTSGESYMKNIQFVLKLFILLNNFLNGGILYNSK